MLASSHLDPILGIDIHWELIPTPAPVPTPLPNPFTGIVFDPIGLACGIAIGAAISAVVGAPFQGPVLYWGCFPATNTGTEGVHIPGHILIPPGTGWAPIPRTPKPVIRPGETPTPPKPITPDNDAIVVFGSKTVTVMGSNAVRLGDLVMSCSEPIRLPSSVVLAVPKGAPILIGGPMSLDIMAAIMASLRTRFMSDSLHSLVSRLSPGRFRNFLHRAVCFLTGHPVDVASGKVLSEHIDVALPGPLPLQLDRVYSSAFADRDGACGHGWSSSLDQAIWRERGKVVLRSDDGREIEFDSFDLPGHRVEPGQSLVHPIERLTLRCLPGDAWEVEAANGLVRSFRPAARASQLGRHPLHSRRAIGPVASIESIRATHVSQRIEFFYDARGFLEWVRDSAGRLLGFEHDAQGHMTALHMPKLDGEGWTCHRRYHYDDAHDLVAVEDALGQRWTFEYVTHLLACEVDRRGACYHFAYDGIGADAWCTRTWADDGSFDRVITYDKAQRRTWVSDAYGFTTTYHMNVIGQVTHVIDALGNTTEHVYDPQTLRRLRTIAADGGITGFDYDAQGAACGLEHPDGARVQLRHGRYDDPLEAVDAIGGVRRWEYDPQGRVIATINPLGERTHYGYEDQPGGSGLPSWATSPGGRSVAFGHDKHFNIAKIRSSSGREVNYTYDQRGQRTCIDERGGVKLTLRYDAEGRVVELARGSGEVQRRRYDAEGNLLEVEEGRRRVELRYSRAGGAGTRVIARIEGDRVERFDWDLEGRLVAHVDVAGRVHRLVRDALGRVIAETPNDGITRHYAYDASGRMVRAHDAEGRVIALERDRRGRVTKVQRPDGFCTYRYRADGYLVEASNELGRVELERDVLGRVVRECCDDDSVESHYDHEGLRHRLSSSLGLVNHLEYGQSRALTRLFLSPTRHELALAFERDGEGREQTRHLPGNLAVHWGFDARKRPARRHTLDTRASGAGSTREVARVREERRWHWEHDDQLRAVEHVTTGEVVRYEHDGLGQVVGEQGSRRTLVRSHDLAGNVRRQHEPSEREFTDDGRLLRDHAWHYTYDRSGHRIERRDASEQCWRYTHDSRGFLRAVERPDGQRIEYDYDALGRRRHKRHIGRPDAGGAVDEVRYVWDGRRLVHEVRGGDDLTTWHWSPHDVAPVAKTRAGKSWSIVADAMGNPTEMYDEAGDLSWQAELDIFGDAHVRVGSEDDCPWRWPGQYEDREAELYYNGFRYYDVQTGAYIARDPLGLLGNPTPYGYPTNPWAWSDPLGLVQDYMSFLDAANAWNAGEGAATPMSSDFIGKTWGLYQKTFRGNEVPVIGDFGDVARYIDRAGPGHAKLSLPMPPSTGFHWNTFVNDQWMQAFIDRNAVVLLASEPTEALLNSAEFGRSVFGREMDQLTAAGYKLMGKLGDRKDPLRMEPPCR
jgi:RHS repeat-associated protein